MQLAEESVDYQLETTKRKCPWDKLLNNLLQDTRRSSQIDKPIFRTKAKNKTRKFSSL